MHDRCSNCEIFVSFAGCARLVCLANQSVWLGLPSLMEVGVTNSRDLHGIVP
jgi:hypothetical protein